jgi:hypothetical protein
MRGLSSSKPRVERPSAAAHNQEEGQQLCDPVLAWVNHLFAMSMILSCSFQQRTKMFCNQQGRQSVHPRQEEKQESSMLVVEKDVVFIKAQ